MLGLIALLIIIGYGSLTSEAINWTRLFHHKLKSPYGTYAFGEVMDDLYGSVDRNRNSILEITDTLESRQLNIVSVSMNFLPTDLEVNKMLEKTEEGSNFVISANYLNSNILDTLGLELDSQSYQLSAQIIMWQESQEEEEDYSYSLQDYLIADTTHVQVLNKTFSKDVFPIKNRDVFTRVVEYDSTTTQVLATYKGDPVILKVNYGEGAIIISTVPHLFSNLYMVQGGNMDVVSYVMSHIPIQDVSWTEFYELGRDEARTPFRYILSKPSLKSALYLTLISLAVFSILEIRRKQRAIPIVVPPSNDSLIFTKTIGNLYFEQNRHRSIAEKRINFFLDHIRTNYYLKTDKLDDDFTESLSKKSGVPLSLAKKITANIKTVRERPEISDVLLKGMSDLIDEFYMKHTKK